MGTEPIRVMAVGDTIISEQGLVAIIGRDPRYHVCGAAHTFEEANRLVRQHRPDLLLIEPFLENRDAIRWILAIPPFPCSGNPRPTLNNRQKKHAPNVCNVRSKRRHL